MDRITDDVLLVAGFIEFLHGFGMHLDEFSDEQLRAKAQGWRWMREQAETDSHDHAPGGGCAACAFEGEIADLRAFLTRSGLFDE